MTLFNTLSYRITSLPLMETVADRAIIAGTGREIASGRTAMQLIFWLQQSEMRMGE